MTKTTIQDGPEITRILQAVGSWQGKKRREEIAPEAVYWVDTRLAGVLLNMDRFEIEEAFKAGEVDGVASGNGIVVSIHTLVAWLVEVSPPYEITEAATQLAQAIAGVEVEEQRHKAAVRELTTSIGNAMGHLYGLANDREEQRAQSREARQADAERRNRPAPVESPKWKQRAMRTQAQAAKAAT